MTKRAPKPVDDDHNVKGPYTMKSTKFAPDAERIEVAAALSQKSYLLSRALETMRDDAFDGEATFYAVTSREMGARLRALSDAGRQLLTKPDYAIADAWEALHG